MVFCPSLFAATSATKPNHHSTEGARLLKSVSSDARQIEASAAAFEKLTSESGATWAQYDRQWNEIQPIVEAMEVKIEQLESMEPSLSAADQQALNQAKTASVKIAWYSRQLGDLVDKVPADLNTPKFKSDSRELVNEAREAAKAVGNAG